VSSLQLTAPAQQHGDGPQLGDENEDLAHTSDIAPEVKSVESELQCGRVADVANAEHDRGGLEGDDKSGNLP
jgi:hypothetical protein